MRCANCGGEIIDGKCVVCGSGSQTGVPNGYMPQPQMPVPEKPYSRTVSIPAWVGRQFISWIPFVGGIVYLIMLIVWACSDKFELTSKNWAIATIIVTVIKIIVGALVMVGLIALMVQVVNNPEFRNEFENFYYYTY